MDTPNPHVTTLDTMKFFVDGCDEWEEAGKPDYYTEEELIEKYPGMSKEDFCGFAIYGLPTQLWLNMELDLNNASIAYEKTKELLETANQQLLDRYQTIEDARKEMKEALEDN